MWPETRVGPQRQCKIRKLVGEKERIVDQTLKHVYNYFLCDKHTQHKIQYFNQFYVYQICLHICICTMCV